jgi:hypothetical protein
MRKNVILLTGLLTIGSLLASCSSLNPFGSRSNDAEDEAAKAAYRDPQEIICEYNKDALNLPITFDTYRALEVNNLSNDPRLLVNIENDKRKILKLNLKYECLCGDAARKRELECSDIENAGRSGANPNFDDGIVK